MTRVYGPRQNKLDPRNVDTKGLIDALVRATLLVDDSERWAVIHHLQRKGPKPMTMIEVFEFDEAAP